MENINLTPNFLYKSFCNNENKIEVAKQIINLDIVKELICYKNTGYHVKINLYPMFRIVNYKGLWFKRNGSNKVIIKIMVFDHKNIMDIIRTISHEIAHFYIFKHGINHNKKANSIKKIIKLNYLLFLYNACDIRMIKESIKYNHLNLKING